MADEKIVVVCDDNCNACKIRQEYDSEYGCIYLPENIPIISKGDVVTIEIKRKENIETERKADIEAENKEYDNLTRITRMENK